jgi:hypothetical protein
MHSASLSFDPENAPLSTRVVQKLHHKTLVQMELICLRAVIKMSHLKLKLEFKKGDILHISYDYSYESNDFT